MYAIRNQDKLQIKITCGLRTLKSIRANVDNYIDSCEVKLTLCCLPVLDNNNKNNNYSYNYDFKEDHKEMENEYGFGSIGRNRNQSSSYNTGQISKTLTRENLLSEEFQAHVCFYKSKILVKVY